MELMASLVFFMAAGLVQDDPGPKIESLIRQLGDDDYATREKASQELRKIGKPAEEALRKAAASADDPEVRERSRGLLEALTQGQKPKNEGKGGEERGAPALPGLGFRVLRPGAGRSVQIMTVNGDSTYRITQGDGSPALVFHRSQAGPVKLEYSDEKGQPQTAESATLEKFLDEHKDLAKKFGISEEGIDYGGMRASFKGALRGAPAPRVFRFAPPIPPRAPELPAAGAFSEVTPALRSQLELAPGQGVVVNHVPAGGAAAELGIRKHDILLEVSGRAVGSPKEAEELLEKAQTATVLRKGQKLTLGAKKDF